MRIWIAVLLLLSVCLPITILAAEQGIEQTMTEDEFRAAGLNKLTAEELAALNAWLSRASVKPATAQEPSESAVATSAASVAPAAPVADAGPALAPRYRQSSSSNEPNRVQSHIAGVFSGWKKGTVFKLENGQHWQVTDASSYSSSAKTNPEVEIKQAMFGSWLMKVGGGNRTARVERIR